MLAYTMGISKHEFVEEMRRHAHLDHFIKGTYVNGEKGCAVGCGINSIGRLKGLFNLNQTDHSQYEQHLGIPRWLAEVEDVIFEGVSVERSKIWPVEFSESIQEGSNLENIKTSYIVYILEQNIINQKEYLNITYDEVIRKVIKDCIKLNNRMILAQKSGKIARILAAKLAAWSVAKSAKFSVRSAESAAWSAESAAWSVAKSAKLGVQSAAWSATVSATVSDKWGKYADKLLQLLKGEK